MDPIMSAERLTKRFGDLTAVDNVDLELHREGILSIIGPNGAGKTTFFNLLTGLLRPDKGKVYFKGEEITNLPPHEIVVRGLSRSFQVVSLFDDATVLDNVRVGIQSTTGYQWKLFSPFGEDRLVNERALQLIERVGLAEVKDDLVGAISHGDRKILDVAVSLVTNPEVLLLDEPTSGLAGEERSRMIHLIEGDLKKEIKMVIVEHDMDVVFSLSDQIMVLNQGKILAFGKPDEIARDSKVQEAYLGGERGYAGA